MIRKLVQSAEPMAQHLAVQGHDFSCCFVMRSFRDVDVQQAFPASGLLDGVPATKYKKLGTQPWPCLLSLTLWLPQQLLHPCSCGQLDGLANGAAHVRLNIGVLSADWLLASGR